MEKSNFKIDGDLLKHALESFNYGVKRDDLQNTNDLFTHVHFIPTGDRILIASFEGTHGFFTHAETVFDNQEYLDCCSPNTPDLNNGLGMPFAYQFSKDSLLNFLKIHKKGRIYIECCQDGDVYTMNIFNINNMDIKLSCVGQESIPASKIVNLLKKTEYNNSYFSEKSLLDDSFKLDWHLLGRMDKFTSKIGVYHKCSFFRNDDKKLTMFKIVPNYGEMEFNIVMCHYSYGNNYNNGFPFITKIIGDIVMKGVVTDVD